MISYGGVTLDQVAYVQKTFPDVKGISLQLRAGNDTTTNDDGANWCEGTATYGTDGNIGTPGAVNEGC